ncbi:ATP-binding protein, partial [Bacillus sp. NPDC060175]|uniref:ATP-binding protein n=1 Tax=Bacillus sp. NPDC060175 TaxID=3347061 RepID=UPI00365379D2
LYDAIYYFVYPAMNINGTEVGWPKGSLGIGVYIFVIALFPISIYLQKRGYVYSVKYLFLFGYMFINLINNLMIYLRTDRAFEHGSMVEMLLILFAPVFVNRKYFYLVSFSVIGKYVLFTLILKDLKVVIPLVLCIFYFIISHSLLKRFQSYVRTVVEMMNNMKETENLAVIGTMSTTIAHEIRNPLTALKGFTQMQKERNPADTMSYDIMLQEIERINGFVSELMLLGKPKPIKYEWCNIREILLYVVQLMESYAAQYKVKFHLQVDGNLPDINGDDKQLKQVLLNIIKNGIESMPEGGDIHICVFKKAGDNLCISVEDQGFGIENDKIEKIGKAFYTTKENGTGLGLMITYKIIEEHQGSMVIQSSMGVGTKVEIYLPTV